MTVVRRVAASNPSQAPSQATTRRVSEMSPDELRSLLERQGIVPVLGNTGDRSFKGLFMGKPKSGKTFSSLVILSGILGHDVEEYRKLYRVAEESGDPDIIGEVQEWRDRSGLLVIDTEHKASSLYVPYFPYRQIYLPEEPTPETVSAIIKAYEPDTHAFLIDSGTHIWYRMLSTVDEINSASKAQYAGWKAVRPAELELLDTMMESPAHLIMTVRTHNSIIVDRPDTPGAKATVRQVPDKIEARNSLPYEFDFIALGQLNSMEFHIEGRIPGFHNVTVPKIGEEVVQAIRKHLRLDR